jgi:hypothetical protein
MRRRGGKRRQCFAPQLCGDAETLQLGPCAATSVCAKPRFMIRIAGLASISNIQEVYRTTNYKITIFIGIRMRQSSRAESSDLA